MLVFVDESGDTGLKLNRGSSPHFVVTAVLFADHAIAQACDERITELASELGVVPEFSFNRTSRSRREAFLSSVAEFAFQYSSIVINKAKLYGPGFKFRKSFYKASANYVFQNCLELLKDATVTFDGSGEREFRRTLQSYLKRKTRRPDGTARIKKVKTEDSRTNNLLQLADMVCGAVARSYSAKADANFCRLLIRDREHNVQYWPA